MFTLNLAPQRNAGHHADTRGAAAIEHVELAERFDTKSGENDNRFRRNKTRLISASDAATSHTKGVNADGCGPQPCETLHKLVNSFNKIDSLDG